MSREMVFTVEAKSGCPLPCDLANQKKRRHFPHVKGIGAQDLKNQ